MKSSNTESQTSPIIEIAERRQIHGKNYNFIKSRQLKFVSGIGAFWNFSQASGSVG
jgi:hypothetical protein